MTQSETSAATNPIAVVDASVWISAALSRDRFHATSAQWLARQTLPPATVVVPAIALAEVAGAIARITDDAALARTISSRLYQFADIVDLDIALAAESASIAAHWRLRGADATYVAVAAQRAIPLVTWDREVLSRAHRLISVMSPTAPDEE